MSDHIYLRIAGRLPEANLALIIAASAIGAAVIVIFLYRKISSYVSKKRRGGKPGAGEK